jgi:glycosyltransferase involved in cell wall biosynthesis
VHTLYICYLSLDEPLVQSQVLPYLRELVGGGVKVSLLTFEKNLKQTSADELAAAQQALAAAGITWSFLPYHKTPSIPATLYDVIAGAMRTVRMVRREGIEVLHARAHIPMAMILIARRLVRCQTVFDLRGLIAEEYVDAGIWQEGSPPFKAIKSIERAGLSHAHQIVVLTRRMREWLTKFDPKSANKITVIPCCVDRTRFAAAVPRASRFELVYAGSVVGLYLVEEMARFFLALKALRPEAMFRILTHGPRDPVSAVLHRVGIDEQDFEIVAINPDDIPQNLNRAHLGISFRKPTFSQIAASPTKIAEYLAAGVPVVSNAGTGDVDELLQSERVGLIVRSFDDASLAEAAAQAVMLTEDPQTEARCRKAAADYFDLSEIGGKRYQELYERIASNSVAWPRT